MTTDYAPAISMFIDRKRVFWGCNPKFAIILHKTAGFYSIEQLAYWFGEDPKNVGWVSSHFGVGLDGRVGQFVALADGAGGNGKLESGHDAIWDQFNGANLNLVTISIEHIDPSINNDTPMTDAQKQASFKLVKFLMDTLGIDKDHIFGHNSIDPVTRARCPGDTYPWNELYDYIDPERTQPAPIVRKITKFMEQSFNDQWDSTARFMPDGKPARRPTGIYTAWSQFQAQGRNFGPPITPEYPSVNWGGDPIIVQEFAHVRAEWSNNAAKFYSVGGQLTL